MGKCTVQCGLLCICAFFPFFFICPLAQNLRTKRSRCSFGQEMVSLYSPLRPLSGSGVISTPRYNVKNVTSDPSDPKCLPRTTEIYCIYAPKKQGGRGDWKINWQFCYLLFLLSHAAWLYNLVPWSVGPSISLSVRPCVSLSVRTSIGLSIRQSVYPSIRQSVSFLNYHCFCLLHGVLIQFALWFTTCE